MQLKDFPGAPSLKDLDKTSRTVQSYMSAWTVDSDGDQFTQGAWSKSITERGPAGTNRINVLYMHNFYQPLAKPSEITTDDTGLLFTWQLPNTVLGNDTLELYDKGVLTEHSVGFDIMRSEENKTDGLDIKEAMLWEGSPVTWGANADTPLVTVGTLAQQIERAEKALRDGSWRGEDIPQMLGRQLSIWIGMLEVASAPGSENAPGDDPTRSASTPLVDESMSMLRRELQLTGLTYQRRGL